MKINRNISEHELLAGCRAGKEKFQKALYEKFSPTMYAVCKRYVKDAMEAESVMVEAFMKVFSKIDQFREEGSLEGWIRRVMVNQSLTYLRKNKAFHLTVELEHAAHTVDDNISGDHLEAADLMKLIGTLPDGYRTVFNLYAIEGYSHKEIGEKLGINENTSKSQLSRARALLQHKLQTLEEQWTKLEENEATSY